jgi:hypothetical protein
MSKLTSLLAGFGLHFQTTGLVTGPPEVPSGRQVQEAVPAHQAEVRRLDKEVAGDKSLADDLAVARAGLAAAQGKTEEALVADERAGLTPSQMVERKLAALLKSQPQRVSHILTAKWSSCSR